MKAARSGQSEGASNRARGGSRAWRLSVLAWAVVLAGQVSMGGRAAGGEPPRGPGGVGATRPLGSKAAVVQPRGGVVPAEPYLEALLEEMRAWPVGQVVRERYRVVGAVRSSGADGVLIERASAREWKVDEVFVDGGVTRRYGPGATLSLEGGLAFVAGIQAKVGQKVMADVNVAGTREVVQGNQRVKVRLLKPAGVVGGGGGR